MSADYIVSALVDRSRQEIAAARAVDAARPIGELRLDIDFYSDADRSKPVEDFDFHAHGRHYKGTGARWCVVKVKWTGSEWKRVRRISGSLKFTDALDRCSQECRRLGLERRP